MQLIDVVCELVKFGSVGFSGPPPSVRVIQIALDDKIKKKNNKTHTHTRYYLLSLYALKLIESNNIIEFAPRGDR